MGAFCAFQLQYFTLCPLAMFLFFVDTSSMSIFILYFVLIFLLLNHFLIMVIAFTSRRWSIFEIHCLLLFMCELVPTLNSFVLFLQTIEVNMDLDVRKQNVSFYLMNGLIHYYYIFFSVRASSMTRNQISGPWAAFCMKWHAFRKPLKALTYQHW